MKFSIITTLMLIIMSAHPLFARREQVIFHFDSSYNALPASPYSGVSVVDLRSNLHPLLIMGGIGFGKDDVITAGTFAEEVTSFGNRLLSRPAPGKDTLLVLIHEHRLSLKVDKGVLSFQVKVDFFKGSAGTYQHLYTADSFYEAYHSKKDETWRGMYNITWLNNFTMAARLGNTATGKTYTQREAILRLQSVKDGLPVYQAAHYPTGIYFTREQFLELKPGLTDFYEWDNGEEDPYPHFYYHKLENGKRGDRIREEDYYAVFNGKRWYKAGRSGLYQMHFIKGDFYFQAPMDGLKGKDGSVLMAGIAGGLLAAGITAITNEARVAGNAHAVTKRSVRLDAETGRYIPDAPPSR